MADAKQFKVPFQFVSELPQRSRSELQRNFAEVDARGGGIRVVTSTTRPGVPYEGQLIYETDTDRLLVYDGTNWVQRGPVRVIGTVTGVVGGGSPDQATSPVPYVLKGGSDVQTYATGGLTVTYSTAFPTGVVTVLVSQGDNSAVIPSVINGNNLASSFKYKIFDTAGAEVAAGGLYRINWLAFGW